MQRPVFLLLDGLNEMPPRQVQHLRKLLLSAPFPFVVTCRTHDYFDRLKDIKSLSAIRIRDLDPKQILTFIQSYIDANDKADSFFTRLGGSADLLRATELFADSGHLPTFWHATYWRETPWNKRTQDDPRQNAYLDLLASQRSLMWLARNPYMLRMMIEIYAACDGEIPSNRGQLFDTFVQTLIARAYERREQGTEQVDRKGLFNALSDLAYVMQCQDKRTRIEVDLAHDHLTQNSASIPAEAFLAAASRSYLLDVGSNVSFRHQLLQEYFAAQVLRREMLRGRPATDFWRPGDWWNSSGWEETAILMAGFHDTPEDVLTWLAPANPELARRCIGESGSSFSGESVKALRTTAWDMAVDQNLAPLSRAYAAQTLGQLGGGRCWISPDNKAPTTAFRTLSLGAGHGKPDICWVEVPTIMSFEMGFASPWSVDPNDEQGVLAGPFSSDEEPLSSHHIKRFWISKYPITWSQFLCFRELPTAYENPKFWIKSRRSPWKAKSGNFTVQPPFNVSSNPVVFVSWYEASAFCSWLATLFGLSVTLPTELQWEVAACYDPASGRKRRYPWGSEIAKGRCNTSELGFPLPGAADLFEEETSPLGLCGTIGNVWEWCSTAWQADWSDPSSLFEYPYVADDGREETDYLRARRVVRGGCYLDSVKRLRTTSRVGACADVRLGGLGFRVVSNTDPDLRRRNRGG